MGPAPSRNSPSPPPPPPPCPRARDLTGALSSVKNNINNAINRLSSEKSYALSAINTKANNTNTYVDYINNQIPNRLKNYENEKRNLLKKRDNKIIEKNSMIQEFNKNLEILKKSNENNVYEIMNLNDVKEVSYSEAYKYNVLKKSIIATTEQYYDAVRAENNMLDNNKIQSLDNYSTDDSKSFYILSTIDSIRLLNNIMFIIYYLLILILVYFIYNKNIPTYSKLILFLILLLFPFFITQMQDNLRYVYHIFRKQ
jgi:hypothetical protein